jgi:type I restriction enzyme M protein
LLIDSDNNRTKSYYDPTCGIGNLFDPTFKNAKYAGQDMDLEALAFLRCRMAMNERLNYDFRHTSDGTLVTDAFESEQFDFVVANPPYGLKNWHNDKVSFDERYKEYGDVSNIIGDYAWVLHCLSKVKEGGEAVIILPSSVGTTTLGNSLEIRKKLIQDGNLGAIIDLPGGIFENTGVKVTVWCLNKFVDNTSKKRVMIMDASKIGQKLKSKVEIDDDELYNISRSYYDYCRGAEYEDSYICERRNKKNSNGDNEKFTYYASRLVGPNELERNSYCLTSARYFGADKKGKDGVVLDARAEGYYYGCME